jgi:hypothetical protein
VRGDRGGDELKGQVPRALVVVKAGFAGTADQLQTELVELVRQEIGAVVALRQVDVVDALPKTRSGEDPAQDHAGDRRRAVGGGAVDDRGRRRHRGLAPGAPVSRLILSF